jgi:acetyl esterase/lipase
MMKMAILSTLAAAMGLMGADHEYIPLWPQGAPGAQGAEAKDVPAISVFLPEKDVATGAAMVICPGGGYGGLASYEGEDYAMFLARHGVAGFVLRYRLGSAGYRHPIMLQDAARAVRWVRGNAAKYGVDGHRVGIMGSSAGGHLASTLLTHFDAGDAAAPDLVDRESSRPDLGVLCYPVITMGEFTHAGSRENLLGAKPDPALVADLSNELKVTKDTPPTFLFHTADDPVVPVENALQFAAALQRNKVPFDLHIYQHGPHGVALSAKPPEFNNPHPWTADLVFWLKQRGFIAN